jgi:23S rRNA pseudouridine1911/1915/1917 synthase
MNCPVVGDMLYSRSGKEFIKFGLLLFSQRIKFKHPFENRIIELELPLPDRFVEFEKEAEFH